MIGLRLSDIGARGSYIVFGLIEALLRSVIAAHQGADAGELLFGESEAGFRLGDFGSVRRDLFGAHTGVDVVAVGDGSCKGGTRLRDGCRQLQRRQLGDRIAGLNAVAFADPDGRELAADFRGDTNLGGTHDADDGRVRAGAPERNGADSCSGHQKTEHNDKTVAAARHWPSSAWQGARTRPPARNK